MIFRVVGRRLVIKYLFYFFDEKVACFVYNMCVKCRNSVCFNLVNSLHFRHHRGAREVYIFEVRAYVGLSKVGGKVKSIST